MSDKIIGLFKVLIKCIPYLFVWYILFLMFSAAKSEGLLSGFSYIFGENLYILICVIGILIFLSIFYLRFFLKKELIIQIISFGMTSLFICVTLVLTNYCDKQFEIFTTDKFINCPGERLSMYFDLTKKHDVNGYSAEEVKKLLGEPDRIKNNIYIDGVKNNAFIYDDGFGNSVYVYFIDEKARYIDYSE